MLAFIFGVLLLIVLIALGNGLTGKVIEGPNSGLISHLKFDDGSGLTAIDSSGNSNSGSLVNNPSWTSGKFNGALSFNGNNYVSLPGIYSLSSGTIGMWIYKIGAGSGNNVITGSYGMQGNERAPTFSFPGTGNGKIGWEFGSLTNKNTVAIIGAGQWVHIAMTYDSNYNVKVYVNGTLDSSGTSVAPGAFFNQIHVGHYGNYGSHYFQGIIDDVHIYNRALTASEVRELYQSSASGITASAIADTSAPIILTTK